MKPPGVPKHYQTHPCPGTAPNRPIAELPIPPEAPAPPVERIQMAAIFPDPEPPALPQTGSIADSSPPLPGIIEKSPVITYQAPAPDQPGLRIDGNSRDTKFPSVFV